LHTLVIICPLPTPAEQIALHRQAFGSTSSKTTCNDRRLLDYIQINILHRVDGVDTSYHSDVLEKDSDLPRSLAWLCSPFVGNPDDCNMWYYSEYRRDNGTLRDTGTNSKAFVGAMKEIVKGRDGGSREVRMGVVTEGRFDCYCALDMDSTTFYIQAASPVLPQGTSGVIER
jgi:hypothetical protein